MALVAGFGFDDLLRCKHDVRLGDHRPDREAESASGVEGMLPVVVSLLLVGGDDRGRREPDQSGVRLAVCNPRAAAGVLDVPLLPDLLGPFGGGEKTYRGDCGSAPANY